MGSRQAEQSGQRLEVSQDRVHLPEPTTATGMIGAPVRSATWTNRRDPAVRIR
jgi:hypothetical protein